MPKPALFPYARSISDPPCQWRSLHLGHPTPLYALAWVCKAPDYVKLIRDGDERDLSQIIKTRWFKKYNFTRSMCPMFYLGPVNKYYLIAMFNQATHPGFAARAQDPDDEVIAAARDTLFITDDLEPSLQWYRYPMDWTKSDTWHSFDHHTYVNERGSTKKINVGVDGNLTAAAWKEISGSLYTDTSLAHLDMHANSVGTPCSHSRRTGKAGSSTTNVRITQPACNFIQHLAAELILCVFEHMTTNELLTASRVCQHWRDLFYTHSEFTRIIDLNSTSSAALSRFKAQLDIRNSGKIQLCVSARDYDFVVDTIVLPIIASHLTRLWRLVLDLHVANEPAVWRALQGKAPMLRGFHLSFDELRGRPTRRPVVPSDIFDGYAPFLYEFGYMGVRLPDSPPPGLSNVFSIVIMEGYDMKVSLDALDAYFPALDFLCLRTVRRGALKPVDGASDTGRADMALPPQPRFDELYLDLGEDVKHIFQQQWPVWIFRTLVIWSPSPSAVVAGLQILPPGPLHLRLVPGRNPESVIVDLRCIESDRMLRFEKPRSRHEDDAAELRSLFNNTWPARVVSVTVALSIWSHPHIPGRIPRLPNAKRVGFILDDLSNHRIDLTPPVTLDCPALERVDLATVHGASTSTRISVHDIERMLSHGFRKLSRRITLGICEGVSVDEDSLHQCALVGETQSYARPFHGREVTSRW